MEIQFVLHNTTVTPSGDKTYIKSQKLIDVIKSWNHSLGKAIGLQKQQRSTKVIDELGLTEETHEFLNCKELFAILHQTIKRLETSSQTEDIKLFTVYFVAKIVTVQQK